MNVQQNYAWWNPVGWYYSKPTQDDLPSFVKTVAANIPLFENRLVTAFKEVDQSLATSIVTYLFQSSLKDLTLRYYFTNQDQLFTINQFSKIFLLKPISKEISYSDLTQDTQVKIQAFIRKTQALFPKNFAGIRFQNVAGASNLTKVVLVAQTHFNYTGTKMTNVEMVDKIRRFEELTTLLSNQLEGILKDKPMTLNIPIENVVRAEDILKTAAAKPSVKQNSFIAAQIDELNSYQIDTDLKATDLLAKQPVFNTLFGSISSAYPQEFTFSMKDGGMEFTVDYPYQGSKFLFSLPICYYALEATKKIQTSQQQFVADKSPEVVPPGLLEVNQDELFYNTSMVAHVNLSTSEGEDKLQEHMNTFALKNNSNLYTL